MDRAIFAINPDAKLEYFRLGREQEPAVKVDAFLHHADQIKHYAVERNQFAIADSYYPGVRMAIPALYSAAVVYHLRECIENIFYFDVKKIKSAISRFSIVTFPPEKLSILQRIPHFDAPTKNSLAMVHYLCDAPDSGVALYRHRQLGYEFVDSARYEAYMRHVRQQFAEPVDYPSGYIAGDTAEFEQIAAFPAAFNRLIMYRGSSLHSGIITPEYNFDSNPVTGRLTITTFIEFND